MKFKRLVSLLLAVVMVVGIGISPISVTPVLAYGGHEGLIVEMQIDEHEAVQFEELDCEKNEGYIIRHQEEMPLDAELLLSADDYILNPAGTLMFTDTEKVLAAILAAGGIHFIDTQTMLDAVTSLYLHLDADSRDIVYYYANNYIVLDDTSDREFITTAETLTPIWEQVRSLFAIHTVDGRQVAKMLTPYTGHVPHFHLGSYVGESVIPVICWNSIPGAPFYWPPHGGHAVSDPFYISALSGMFPSSAIIRGNMYTAKIDSIYDWLWGAHLGLSLDVFRNNVWSGPVNVAWRNTGDSMTPLGFVIVSYDWAELGIRSWIFMYAHIYTYRDRGDRLIMSSWDWNHAFSFLDPIPNFLPSTIRAIIGNLAPENIMTNIAMAQAAFLDAAGYVTASDSVRIRLPGSAKELVGAMVTDVVILDGVMAIPSYSAKRILSAILAAGGIYFESTEYMEAAAIRLYRTLPAFSRNLVNYKSDSLIYVADTVRATRWESIAVYSIWQQASNLFRCHVPNYEQRIEITKTSVAGRPPAFHMGYYDGYSVIPVIRIDSIPRYEEIFSSGFYMGGVGVSASSYVDALLNLLPETVTILGDDFSMALGSGLLTQTLFLYEYRNGERWGSLASISYNSMSSITPVGYAILLHDNNMWYLNPAYILTNIDGGVQLHFPGARLFGCGFNGGITSPPTNHTIPNFVPLLTSDFIVGHLATKNLITCINDAWQVVRETAGITDMDILTGYEINFWFPSHTHYLINATVTDVVIADTGNITRRTGLVRYASPINDVHDYTAIFVYDDAYFFLCAYEYNPSLATLSLLFQLSSWGSNDVSGYYNKMINAQRFFDTLDFTGFAHNYTDFDHHGIVGKPTKDSIGAVAAHRVIRNYDESTGNTHEYTLIALAIRGGGYESEWASNLTIGRSGHHAGFYQSSNIAAQFLQDYISYQEITGDIKLWLTGFSRAGAVANLLAGGINSGRIVLPAQVTLDSRNFFTYTFATPAGVLSSSAVRFGNIFNIIHLSDPVPMVAPIYWQFMRYGIDRPLPSRVTCEERVYNDQHSRMLYQLNTLESIYENDARYQLNDFTTMRIGFDFNALINAESILIHENRRNPQPQSVFLSEFVTSLARDYIRTRDNYVDVLQEAMRNTAGLIFGTTTQQTEMFVDALTNRFLSASGWAWIIWDLNRPFGGPQAAFNRVLEFISEALEESGIPYTLQELDSAATAISELLFAVAISNPNRATTLIMNLESIGQAHYPEIYLAWLMSMDPNFQYGGSAAFTTGHFRIIRINCPVDVRVYRDNTLVAAIINDTPQDISSIVTAINDDGEKLVFLPATGDYRIELIVTGDSTMTFSVSEFNPQSGTVNRIINYFDIPIITGQRFEALIPAFSNADLEDTTTSSSSTMYILSTVGTTIPPCEDLTGYQATTAYFNVSAASTNSLHGIAFGSGLRQRGTYAIVTAIPYDGYAFFGWYVDNIIFVSNEAEYRFRVMEDVSLTARFIAVYSDLVAEVNAATNIIILDSLLRHPGLGLNLRLFNLLSPEMRNTVLYVIVMVNDFTNPEEIQALLDLEVGRFVSLTVLVPSDDAYVGSHDTMINSARGVKNSYYLQVRSWTLEQGHYATFLQFDIRDLGIDPSNIGLVELEVYMTNLEFGIYDKDDNGHLPPYNLAVRGFPLPRTHEEFDYAPWSEDTLTWNTAQNVLWNNISPPGKGYTWDLLNFFDYHGGAIDYILIGKSTDTVDDIRVRYVNTWLTLDVTSYVRDALKRGDEHLTLMLFEGPVGGSHKSSFMTFASKEHSNGNGPRLEFTVFTPATIQLKGLADAIAYAQILNPADFTIFTWLDVYDELQRALLVYNNENATQAQVDLAESLLRTRLAALVTATPVPVVDRTALVMVIADAESQELQNYCIFAWFDLQDELVMARNIRDNLNATQLQVDTAEARLRAAIDALVQH